MSDGSMNLVAKRDAAGNHSRSASETPHLKRPPHAPRLGTRDIRLAAASLPV